MTTPKPSAADRENRARLLGAQKAAVTAVEEHAAICWQCRTGRDWHKRACDRGWELAKAAHAAMMAVRAAHIQAAGDATTEQGTLW